MRAPWPNEGLDPRRHRSTRHLMLDASRRSLRVGAATASACPATVRAKEMRPAGGGSGYDAARVSEWKERKAVRADDPMQPYWVGSADHFAYTFARCSMRPRLPTMRNLRSFTSSSPCAILLAFNFEFDVACIFSLTADAPGWARRMIPGQPPAHSREAAKASSSPHGWARRLLPDPPTSRWRTGGDILNPVTL